MQKRPYVCFGLTLWFSALGNISFHQIMPLEITHCVPFYIKPYSKYGYSYNKEMAVVIPFSLYNWDPQDDILISGRSLVFRDIRHVLHPTVIHYTPRHGRLIV